MRIILGGSFDPVHNGHLRIAVELAELFDRSPVSLIPCKDPVHKDATMLEARSRVVLLQAATDDEPLLDVDTREVDRAGESYSVTTLEELSGEGEQVIMALGTDSALELASWYRAGDLSGLCNLVVLKRPEYEDSVLISTLKSLGFVQAFSVDELQNSNAGRFLLHEVTQLAISSSDIRRRLVQKLTIRYLVPDAVNAIICNNHFYSIPDQ